MTDHDTPNLSADPASKPKKPRTKLTPEQRIARLEQKLARAKTQQQQNNRKLQTRAKIILGAAFVRFVDSLEAGRQQKAVQSLWALVSERDRQALLDSGLMPDSVSLKNTSDTEKPDSGSAGSETGEKSGD